MLIVAIATWTPETDEAMWTALAERNIPLPEGVKIVEYYHLLGHHKAIAIFEAPDTNAIAMSALNWVKIGKVEYLPAITTREWMKLRAQYL
jgi:uncharacterized protein with GYD domain